MGCWLMKYGLIFVICLMVAACTSVRPGPEVFFAAERAIKIAEEADCEELAPVELRFAREKLASAHLGIEKQKYDVAMYLLEQAEINAELALEKSRSALSRRRVNELRKRNEELDSKLRLTFGDDF